MTHAAQRTRSRRRAAGSRRNKKYRFVGHLVGDSRFMNQEHWDIQLSSKPNHAARQLDRTAIEQMFALPVNVKLA